MSTEPIRLDGSAGGPQLLRSALGLSLAGGAAFSIEGLRGGLDAKAIACLTAARAICGARLVGGELGSERLCFEPGPVRAGDYLLDLGRGSICDAVEVIAAPLALAGPSVVKLRGGTHLSHGVAFHYLRHVWQPAMQELGFNLSLELGVAGFEPEGGGEVTLTVRGFGAPRSLDRRTRGTLCEVRVLSTVSGLPLETAVAHGERAVQRLKESGIFAEAENIPVPASRSRGSMCLVVATFERTRAGFAAVGAPDADPCAVGERAAEACVDFIRSHGAIDVPQAERLLIPMAAIAARSAGAEHRLFRLSTPRLSEGMLSIAALAGCFLEAEVALIAEEAGAAEARVANRREGMLGALAGAARQTQR